MISVTESIVVPHPPNEVFEVVADPYQQLRWDTSALQSVEPLTPGPLGQGSRFLVRYKGLGSAEYEFAEFEPGRRFAHWGSNLMGKIYHTFELEAVPEGTRLTQTSTIRLTGMGRMLAPFLRKSMRKRLQTMNKEISEYLRTRPPGGTSLTEEENYRG